jgi:hypothetical protein
MKSTKSPLMTVVLVTSALLAASVFAQEKSDLLSEDERGAIGSTRTLNTAEVAYMYTFNKGYSGNLLVLGEGPAGSPPSETQAGLVESELAKGKVHNYVFTYKPGAKDKDGHINAYQLTARPAKWQKGLVGFFTNQTGIIRWTKENRLPTVKDPSLDSLPGI